jgi:hypothetical protein
MKIFLVFIMVLFFSALMAQTDTASDSEVISDEVTTEAAATDEVEDKVDEVSDDTQSEVPYEKSDCVCPENEVQQQEASIFPPGSVFMVTPLAPEEQKVPEKKNVIPGYIENLEPGFDDKSYKQIPFKE